MRTRSTSYALTCGALLALAGCGGGGGPETSGSGSGQFSSQSLTAVAAPQAQAENLVVRARANLAGGVGAQMQVRVNGVLVAEMEVRESAYQDYPLSVPAIAVGDKVDVVFTNDDTVGGQDRNLYVESITVNGATVAATAAGVTLDRGTGAQAFDGIDVLPGQRSLLWNGALRFVAGGGASLSAACESFYAARPDFALDSSKLDGTALAPLAKPARGQAVAEPKYKTCLVRASDNQADGLKGFAWNGYARRQAFNADGSLYLVYQEDGFWNVYDAKTNRKVRKLAGLASDDAEPQWHPANPQLLTYFPQNGVGMQLLELNVTTDSGPKVVADLSSSIRKKWPEANAAWTKGEGSPSRDGRYWCLMVDNQQWGGVGVITWDRQTNAILGMVDLRNSPSPRPDHVSMSPSGNYCVVSHVLPSVGTIVYDRDLTNPRKILNGSQHSDIAIDANGDDVFVTAGYSSSVGTGGDVSMTNLRTGQRTVLFNAYGDGGGYENAMHISGKAFNKPGWVLVSTYAGVGKTTYAGKRPWFHEKLFAMELKANPTIYNLAENRSTSGADKMYRAEPSATVNRDFTKVYFNSNWGSGREQGVETYIVEIPAGSIKALAPTTPPGTPPTTPPETPPTTPPALPLVVSVTQASRSGYSASYVLTTSQAAKCRAASSAGHDFGALYEDLSSNAAGLVHSRTLTLGAPNAQDLYAVCKATVQGTQAQVIIHLD